MRVARGPAGLGKDHCFESTRRESLGRNRGREGKARVPDVAILATAKRLVPPTLAEGFDEIRHVRLMEAGNFEIFYSGHES
jgi:hypothetical protein